jgi:GxxExxY protein
LPRLVFSDHGNGSLGVASNAPSRLDISADYTDYADFFRYRPRECLEASGDHGIPFRPQAAMPVFYKGRRLKAPFSSRFCLLRRDYSRVESIDQSTKVGEIEWAQVLNYLKASSHERGLLINFGAKSLEHSRFIQSHDGAQRI